ncbi:hypothetical protein LEP1GSC116_0755, partial [Leptospira interrogans serovar Icterohaemorrhagiae str. Verdun HP]
MKDKFLNKMKTSFHLNTLFKFLSILKKDSRNFYLWF